MRPSTSRYSARPTVASTLTRSFDEPAEYVCECGEATCGATMLVLYRSDAEATLATPDRFSSRRATRRRGRNSLARAAVTFSSKQIATGGE